MGTYVKGDQLSGVVLLLLLLLVVMVVKCVRGYLAIVRVTTNCVNLVISHIGVIDWLVNVCFQ